jgi:hypothetical protein
MDMVRPTDHRAALLALEAAATAARAGFACNFSNASDYERALIAARRAEGRYRKPRRWPHVLLGCGVVLMAAFSLSALLLR